MSLNARADRWTTRFGLIMAVAGNAVGLGNFLRFPGKAEPYGGAFMVPYFLALILLGIPLMWIEWTIGRHGGGYGHGTTPGQFHRLWKHPISKYLGIGGVLLPAMVGLYYIYIESWSLGYAWESIAGSYWGKTSHTEMAGFFQSYLGLGKGTVSFSAKAYTFFMIALAINLVVMSRGIAKGIEFVAKYAMPALFVLGIILCVRVLTLPPVEGRTIGDGLARIWRIDDWSVLGKPDVWIAAAGQIFFTLSVGLGMVHSYASYLRKQEDITLSGLSACAANEFVEVILGGTIAVPAAVLFFGAAETHRTVEGGTFALGFHTLPLIFQQMPAGQFFAVLWFILLFLAGLTSSMAMFTPLLLFLEDELGLKRKQSASWIAVTVFILMQPVVLFMGHGVVDELDYWMGEFGLVLFAAVEAVIFAWIFGMNKGWEEMHHGAELRVPRVFYYVMKYVTPVFCMGLVVWWLKESFWAKLTMEAVRRNSPQDVPYLWLARAIMLGGAAFLVWGVSYAWRTHPKFFEQAATD